MKLILCECEKLEKVNRFKSNLEFYVMKAILEVSISVS